MKNLIKSILCILLTLILSLCFVACGNPQGDDTGNGGDGDSSIVTPGGDNVGGEDGGNNGGSDDGSGDEGSGAGSGDSGSGDGSGNNSGDNGGDSGSGDGEGNDQSFGPDSSVPEYLIVSNQEELDNALSLVESGQNIFIEQGTLTDILIINESSVSFTISGEKNSSGEIISILPKIEITSNTAPIVIKNLCFNQSVSAYDPGGIKLNGTTNVLIEDCTFYNYVFVQGASDVKNLTINDCTFKNIASERDLVSTINMPRYQNFTLKNSYFENIQYNVVQIGQHLTDREPVLNGGDVLVEGNTFKDIGSRILYFVYLDTVNSCQVVNNKFYSNEDSFAENGDDEGIKKTDGLYIHTKTTLMYNLEIGVNYWEEIPELIKKYLPVNAIYNDYEQLTIGE